MKKILIITGGTIAGLAALLWLVPQFLSWEHYRDDVRALSERVLGTEMRINGEIRAVILPYPHLTAEDVIIRNAPGASRRHMLRAPSMEASISLGSLFTDVFRVRHLTLVEPKLELEILTDGRRNWETVLDPVAVSELTASGGPEDTAVLPLTGLEIVRGTVVYRDTPAGTEEAITDITMEFTADSPMGPFAWEGRATHKQIDYTLASGVDRLTEGGQSPASFRLKARGVTVSLEGMVTLPDNFPAFTGKATVNAPDLAFAVHGTRQDLPYPLRLEGAMALSRDRVELTEMAVTAGDSVLEAHVVAEWEEAPEAVYSLGGPVLNIDALIAALFPRGKARASPSTRQANAAAHLLAFPNTLEARGRIRLDAAQWGQGTLQNLDIEADLAGQELVFQRATGVLPGDAQFTLFGILGQYREELRFEGNLEAEGRQLRQTLAWLGMPMTHVPEPQLAAYKVQGNILVTGNEVRLTEMRGRFDQTRLTGAALVRQTGTLPEIDATVRLDTMDLDAYLPVPTPLTAEEREERKRTGQVATLNMAWLHHIGADVTMRTAVDAMTLFGRPFRDTRFTLHAQPENLVLEDLGFATDILRGKGAVGVRLKDHRPFFETNLALGAFNTASVLPERQYPTPLNPPKGTTRWSRERFDLSFLRGFDAAANLTFPSFRHAPYTIENLVLEGTLKQGALQIDTVQGNIFDGMLNATVDVQVHTIPTLVVSFTFDSIDLDRLARQFAAMDTLSGRLSAVGGVTTSGINQFSLVSNLEGSVNLAGRQIGVKGLDVPALTSRVRNVRNVADVINIARISLDTGQTTFDTLDGQLTIQRGLVQSAGLHLTSAMVNGTLSGTVDLPKWTQDLLLQLAMQVREDTEAPIVGMTIRGPIDAPERRLDTKALQEYVAKRAAEKWLRTPPVFE